MENRVHEFLDIETHLSYHYSLLVVILLNFKGKLNFLCALNPIIREGFDQRLYGGALRARIV